LSTGITGEKKTKNINSSAVFDKVQGEGMNENRLEMSH
jgi:hypothetical protein